MLIKDINPQTAVSGQFLILEAQLRTAKNGSQFMALRLGDKSGEIGAKIWDASEDISGRIPAGQVIEVRNLKAREFAGTVQLELDAKAVSSWRVLPEAEVDFAAFLPTAPSNREELWRRLETAMASVAEPHLAALLRSFFGDDDLRAAFAKVPAAIKRHHVYIGGLLEHTAGVVALCEAAARVYPMVDRDLLITGAILHDIGKIASYRIGRSFEGTDEGKLLGHLILGVQMVAARIDELRKNTPEGFPEELRLCLEHLLISHHGIMEWGSPVEPVSLEACLLHHADNMDAQATKYLNALRAHQPTAGLWTNYDAAVGRSIYTGRAFAARDEVEQA
ncbi:MAG: 3'-5' exoribonuclease YhaM family protein [Bacteroidota bacterium]